MLLPKAFMTLSIFNQCPSATSATGVNMSLKAPGFAMLPAAHSTGNPGEHTLH